MTLVRSRRAVALAVALSWCFIRLGLLRLRGPLTPEHRALWLQAACRWVLAAVGIRYGAKGKPPRHGLVVSNHLSYLDIAVYAAVMPCVFVSKVEVRRWPVFGWAARCAGTIFLDRASHGSAIAAAETIAGRLEQPVPVLLFPEGTSSDGSRVLRFHSTLFAPAVGMGAPVTAAAVRYAIADGDMEREVCWFGDAEFVAHLWKTLGREGLSAEVVFAEPRVYSDRRIAARSAHAEVEAQRAECVVGQAHSS